MLSGTISVAACCDSIEVWHAVVIAFIACLFYSIGSKLLIKAELDDPTESFLIYGVQGLWGSIAAGIFHREKGLLYTGSGKQLLIQTVGALALITFTTSISYGIFKMLKMFKRFRIGVVYEIVGLDALTRE